MRLAEVFQRAVGGDASVGFSAYDGSRAGSADADVRIEVRSPEALSYLASAPGELGLARAYVTGNLEIIGDVYGALVHLSALSLREVPWLQRIELLGQLGRQRLNARVEIPPQERRLHGLRHSKARDREAIAHHYDVSNAFYEWVLGPSMAYTCAVYPTATSTLEQAQFAKHDLVARKLGLEPGMRLLDVGCGWGGMVMHAAREYGVKALGVTLSRNQAEWAQKAIVDAGLSELAEVRYLDYRDVRENGFDAVSSIGLTEHIGKAKLPAYFRSLYRKLRPGGRMLNHCITRPDNRQRARTGGFINRYVFPDGELVGPGHLVSLMHDTGFEVRHEENIREHYALTLAAWGRNLDEHWDEAVAEVGAARARVWRLYLAASRLGFERNNIQLHQVLGVKLDGTSSGMPLRPDWN
ncbi:cyclopropane-fatty-acyl-phospholipid synthase family protein [Actinosynnema sp. NPDC047251]|uniref:Cyclopropane-fatty-acyl-phospholipid synthase n=1 Tax=Saccharothrix espanaensis (strain ATCC 51144 / DSM 44229 / JCM 9112 / NBRC 15066 / NRRL 15764) TaxID=1179773 RepID=K0KB10_SACES|nr:cyclopropane-fatty-acyl-phospholipid synthase family protein [Saccharothrix espanaensis]CCH34712.1 Cyclopropane-fatty-acyl-phospholipid synthase [Saccharothrix espanaensis DSM 44229]